jgi:hypothetical protein
MKTRGLIDETKKPRKLNYFFQGIFDIIPLMKDGAKNEK